MFKNIIKKLFKIAVYIFGIAGLILVVSRIITGLFSRERIQTVDEVETQNVAIVFGAGLRRSGEPTAILKDRVETAADLYFNGKVKKILMSGDNRFVDYDEPTAMKTYAIELGVPAGDIVLDFAGRRTYDTCYRALNIFEVDQAVLVTQGFHLPRAIYTCEQLGVEVVGVDATIRDYSRRSIAYWNLREMAATVQAMLELHLTHPLPVLGDKEPITFP